TTMEKLILLVTPTSNTKPGVCPGNNFEEAMLGVCAEMCSHDNDCPNDEKCCSNGCGHQCMPPYNGIYIVIIVEAFSDLLSLSCVCLTEKPGVCPSKNLGEEGLCVEMCSHDSNCPNDQKCCSNGCGHQCMYELSCCIPPPPHSPP
uniref:WAP domain-containing protein n=1 Tax=Sinocyclocheilus anshuiensis TaxID=1608454 RepID=A0A671K5I5_9TELE